MLRVIFHGWTATVFILQPSNTLWLCSAYDLSDRTGSLSSNSCCAEQFMPSRSLTACQASSGLRPEDACKASCVSVLPWASTTTLTTSVTKLSALNEKPVLIDYCNNACARCFRQLTSVQQSAIQIEHNALHIGHRPVSLCLPRKGVLHCVTRKSPRHCVLFHAQCDLNWQTRPGGDHCLQARQKHESSREL